jgi:filamentous hemagglutinin
MRELARDGVKHTPDDIVRIARAPNGRIVFLEQGTDKSGLRHIVNRHGDDFQNQGILESQIADYVMKAVIEGSLVGRQGSRLIYEFTYNDQTRWVAVTVSSNGYIVGANPRSMP